MNLIGNTRIPGPVSDNYSPGNLMRKRGMQWKRLYLSQGTKIDPSTILNTLTETVGASSVATVVNIDGGTSTNKCSEALTYTYDMTELFNNWDGVTPYHMCLITTAEPGNTSNMYVVCGMASSAGSLGSAHQMFAGCHWDSGSGPDLRVGSGTNPTPSDSGARTNLLHMAATFNVGPVRRWDSVHAYGVDASFDYDSTKHSTSGVTMNTANPKTLQPYITIGRSNAVAGAAEVGFRAYIMIGPTQDTWWPS